MLRHLFAYGTLLPEFAPAPIAPIVRQLRLVGQGTVRGRLYDLGDYPGAILCDAGSIIYGGVFEVPNAPTLLRKLDSYEEFDAGDPRGSEFVRKRCIVDLEDGTKLWCWTYVYNRAPGKARLVIGGDFSKVRGRRLS